VRIIALIAAGWLAAAVFAGPAAADPHQVRAGQIILSSRVVRASIGHAPNTAAYLMITNDGDAPDSLVSASCACAAQVGIHSTKMMGGMMMMGDAAPLVIPAHRSVTFKPGGLHLMLTGLKEKLVAGGEQDLTLTFQHQGEVKAAFHIRAQIPTDAPPMAGMSMGH
jgi:periplasmic copper chaperone A